MLDYHMLRALSALEGMGIWLQETTFCSLTSFNGEFEIGVLEID